MRNPRPRRQVSLAKVTGVASFVMLSLLQYLEAKCQRTPTAGAVQDDAQLNASLNEQRLKLCSPREFKIYR